MTNIEKLKELQGAWDVLGGHLHDFMGDETSNFRHYLELCPHFTKGRRNWLNSCRADESQESFTQFHKRLGTWGDDS